MRTKSKYTNPKPGTKVARVLRLIKRSQGATTYEISQHIGDAKPANDYVGYLRDMAGYDIRSFPVSKSRAHPDSLRGAGAFCCVGRYNWDGSYVDYLTNLSL